MTDLRSMLIDTAAAAASHAVSRVKQPEMWRGRVTEVIGTYAMVAIGGGTARPVYNPVSADVGDDVLLDLRPGGTALIDKVLP